MDKPDTIFFGWEAYGCYRQWDYMRRGSNRETALIIYVKYWWADKKIEILTYPYKKWPLFDKLHLAYFKWKVRNKSIAKFFIQFSDEKHL